MSNVRPALAPVPAACPIITKCPIFSKFGEGALSVLQALYCEGVFTSCERFVRSNAGDIPPLCSRMATCCGSSRRGSERPGQGLC